MKEDIQIIDGFFENYEPKLPIKTSSLLRQHMKVLRLKKKHIILRENQIRNHAYLIIDGAAKSYYIQNGIKVNTWFAFENEVIGSLRNFNNLPSRETFELLENSLLISFDLASIKPLMQEDIEICNFINASIIEYALFLEDKIHHAHLRSAEEKFLTLLAQQPEVFQRVSLTDIASFLGVSRETLSRLRAK